MDISAINKNVDNIARFKSLDGDIECDIVIVGGGITGCILAYYLSKTNQKVVILEKDRIASNHYFEYGASVDYEWNMSNFKARLNADKTKQVVKTYSLLKQAMEDFDDILSQTFALQDYRVKDSLMFSTRKTDIKKFENEVKLRNEAGILTRLVIPENCDIDINFKVGLLCPNGARQFNPVEFCHNILSFCPNIAVYENTKAEYIDKCSGYNKVITQEKHNIITKKVVFTEPNFMQQQEKTLVDDIDCHTIITEDMPNISDALKRTVLHIFGEGKHEIKVDGDMLIVSKLVPTGAENEDVYRYLLSAVRRLHICAKGVGLADSNTRNIIKCKDNLPYIFSDGDRTDIIYMFLCDCNVLFSVLAGKLIAQNLCFDNGLTDLECFKIR